ncbi:hypothetical protein E2562_029929 [Oryza meyeriana var. granulata]|uniref:Uncharacterized protein n=1 Tax=Oryza meyeriana var. granulata TaxID=110450 RepID=A0A6G1CUS0_9ORYZ|nr:hypothetical protein E2562_029929 [Oryza meyeriana var. granulata]
MFPRVENSMVSLVLREDAPVGRNASSKSGIAANLGMGVVTPVMERMGTKGHHAFPDEGVMMATVVAMAALWSSARA